MKLPEEVDPLLNASEHAIQRSLRLHQEAEEQSESVRSLLEVAAEAERAAQRACNRPKGEKGAPIHPRELASEPAAEASGSQRKPAEASGSQRKPAEASGSQRKPAEASGSQRKPAEASGSQRRAGEELALDEPVQP